MKSTRCIQRCMRFEVSLRQEAPRISRTADGTRNLKKKPTKREIIDFFFDYCEDCTRMSAIPPGAFAACKIREHNERRFLISNMDKKGGNDKESKRDAGYSKNNTIEEGRELTPLKYNSKLMNSIWGLYNRYSVHNFKKNTDADNKIIAAARWGSENIRNRPPKAFTVENTAAAVVQQLLGTKKARF